MSTANILEITGSKEARSDWQIYEIPVGVQFKLRGYISNAIFFLAAGRKAKRSANSVVAFLLFLSFFFFSLGAAGRRRRFVKKMFRRVMHICPVARQRKIKSAGVEAGAGAEGDGSN